MLQGFSTHYLIPSHVTISPGRLHPRRVHDGAFLLRLLESCSGNASGVDAPLAATRGPVSSSWPTFKQPFLEARLKRVCSAVFEVAR